MSRNNKFRKGGTLGNLTLTPAQAARLKSDSKPVVFSEQDLRDILGDQSRHLSYTPPLDFLNISTVRSCMNEALRGAYAQVQWIWEQLEPADAVLASCVEKRDTALKKLPWRIVKKKGLSDLEDAIADAQLRTAKDFCNAISNMDEAIAAFGQASFRHFRRLQWWRLPVNLSCKLPITGIGAETATMGNGSGTHARRLERRGRKRYPCRNGPS